MSPENRAWIRTVIDILVAGAVVALITWATSGAVRMSVEFYLAVMALSLAHRANIKTGE